MRKINTEIMRSQGDRKNQYHILPYFTKFIYFICMPSKTIYRRPLCSNITDNLISKRLCTVFKTFLVKIEFSKQSLFYRFKAHILFWNKIFIKNTCKFIRTTNHLSIIIHEIVWVFVKSLLEEPNHNLTR